MGNVGLNFGSATSGAGFDVTATVNQIVTNLQAVEMPWKTQLTNLANQDAQLSSLGTQLSTLTTDLHNLTDFSGIFAAKQGSSSNTNVLSLTSASTSAVAGTHTVTVQSLAQTSTAASGVVAASDVLAGSVSIQVGSGAVQTVNVNASNPTLAGLAAAINAASIGVTATVLTDTNGARLSVVSSTPGAAGTLTVSSGLTDTTTASSAVSFSQIQTGLDASMLVDGVQLTSASNTVTNAIPGVTFQLLSAPSPASSIQVVITNDTTSVASAIQTFVTDYNKVMKAINTQEGKDSSGNPEPLFGSTVLAQLQQSLQGALNATFGSGAVSSAYSLGITANQDGTISLNTDTLTSMLNTNYSDVSAFFQNAGSFGASFANTLNNLGSSYSTGAITLALNENKSQEANLNDDIARQEALIATQKTNLTAELNAANQILQSIPAQINQINEMYSAITGYSKTQG
ncbi:MAG TPA: flagellar filament capping protein FliD [Acidisarcina sp.]|nr:flagellar filament capping protein FliD [Acidisarcina sp.]